MAVVRWQVWRTSPNTMGCYEKMAFLLELQSFCMDLQNSNGKLLNLVCSMLVLKLEILIQNRRALIAV